MYYRPKLGYGFLYGLLGVVPGGFVGHFYYEWFPPAHVGWNPGLDYVMGGAALFFAAGLLAGFVSDPHSKVGMLSLLVLLVIGVAGGWVAGFHPPPGSSPNDVVHLEIRFPEVDPFFRPRVSDYRLLLSGESLAGLRRTEEMQPEVCDPMREDGRLFLCAFNVLFAFSTRQSFAVQVGDVPNGLPGSLTTPRRFEILIRGEGSPPAGSWSPWVQELLQLGDHIARFDYRYRLDTYQFHLDREKAAKEREEDLERRMKLLQDDPGSVVRVLESGSGVDLNAALRLLSGREIEKPWIQPLFHVGRNLALDMKSASRRAGQGEKQVGAEALVHRFILWAEARNALQKYKVWPHDELDDIEMESYSQQPPEFARLRILCPYYRGRWHVLRGYAELDRKYAHPN